MNLKSSNVFLKLFFTINWLVATVFCYNPSSRVFQSSVLIGSKIYYFGGFNGSDEKNDAFYFDVNTSEYTVIDNIPVDIYQSSSVIHPKDENICLLIGGFAYKPGSSSTLDSNLMSPEQVYRFDTQTSKWSIVETSNKPSVSSRRYLNGGVSDDNGTIYFFAHPDSSLHSDPSADSFIKLDINMMSCKDCSMKDLLFYDINSSKWSSATAQGESIDGRVAHTAVLTSDERLIIYGGFSYSYLEYPNITLAVLKIRSSSYEWSIPSSDNKSHPPLAGHSATIYKEKKELMYIAFGRSSGTDKDSNETIFALNTVDFSRIDLVPLPNKPNLKLKLGISLGLTAGLIIIGGIVGYYFWRKRKNRQTNDKIITNDDNINDNKVSAM
ncbi:2434_t:CDS:2 [Diversispora eburnea]|uniref:2434_t:CDS:1 n=1 Tax=Diversispora eburnea TaxID=1213867 RepID=A0A9N8Z2K0_9GLOM|nr:2434_t:CDS:2 [Diversispora eburnea]